MPEWAAGFTDRFGVTFVDFESAEKTRYPKRSAYFLRDYFGHLIREARDEGVGEEEGDRKGDMSIE
ncbi:hypothetical protein EJ05DRAFT_478276 [Pseudovirgaria hyperparasitica]|uniref:Uncharacterized protein n=1 Tax=Pseudovirgaria hyperparasitica TaxID=470096 RepID=A0A6A6W031_9PEZI|nr:uncharacterized protein EJ05DRAFT_478276 [Pseudovirgaria hyperparasitica]KAF2756262.1 hypothetical protein EJ05DRAFT_478276 [Pseudovirgaria hyperparasitica]